MMRKIVWLELAAATVWLLFAGIALAQAQVPLQPPMVEQWHQKAQADMAALTSALNLGLTAINSDMEHLRAEITSLELALKQAQDQAKAAEEKAKAAEAEAAKPADNSAPEPPH